MSQSDPDSAFAEKMKDRRGETDLVARLAIHLKGWVEGAISEGMVEREDCDGDFALLEEAQEFIRRAT